MEHISFICQREGVGEWLEEKRQRTDGEKQTAQKNHGKAEKIGESLGFEHFADSNGNKQSEKGPPVSGKLSLFCLCSYVLFYQYLDADSTLTGGPKIGENRNRPDMLWPDCHKPCRELVARIPLLLVGMVLQPTMAFTGQPIALSRASRGIGLCAFDPFVFHGRVEVVFSERGTV